MRGGRRGGLDRQFESRGYRTFNQGVTAAAFMPHTRRVASSSLTVSFDTHVSVM
jgi:hypothetical protein